MSAIKKSALLFIVFNFLNLQSMLFGQGQLQDYQRAERLLPQNVEKLVFNFRVSPQWIEGSGASFWYRIQRREGKVFMRVDPDEKRQFPAFDHMKLAESLSKILGRDIQTWDLPFDRFKYEDENRSIVFTMDKEDWICDLKTYSCTKYQEDKPRDPGESMSPDGKWTAVVRDFNLYIRETATGEEYPLSTDGREKYDYATSLSWYRLVNISSPEEETPHIYVNWSPDSKMIVTQRLDRRKAKNLYLFQSLPEEGYRAYVYSYERALPGDQELTMIEYVLFDVPNKKQLPVYLPPYEAFLSQGLPEWSKDGKRLFLQRMHRGYQKFELIEIDANSGNIRSILQEGSNTNVDPGMLQVKFINGGKEILLTSERDGWNHIYLFDGESGALKRQLTKGEYVVRNLLHINEKLRKVYFTASGREPDRDPYLQHVYSITLEGSELTLLTPENAEHEVSFSSNGKYFIDNFSRIDTPPQSVLRDAKNGDIIRSLETADIRDLLSTGWQGPQPFKVKARDGKTEIYGVIFRPSNFDPQKKYPVIDSSYTGPHTFKSPKSFYRAYRNNEQPLAELGFVVVTIDGMGTAMRSKKFHDFSYKNLGDIGAEDHIAGIQQLAAQYPWMDISSVGIYGHSAGGYDAAHALLIHPEFYKVGVASAGNHDHR
ncbi:MAG: DPP IV N-terminal domain-containing protein, partial [Candidatus Aminicenantes bacterium]|nr:DPP IV N-terminal domain-containing protein [Candidatus Aminicenantes bacterium]